MASTCSTPRCGWPGAWRSCCPPQLGQIYFTNSGAEAIEGALKTARKRTGRIGFVAFDGAYHGDTMGALALAGNRRVSRAL